jgi:hypothetical protein
VLRVERRVVAMVARMAASTVARLAVLTVGMRDAQMAVMTVVSTVES